MSITTRKLKKDELFLVRQVADIVWPVTFRKILSEKQIDYMMQMMYAPEVLSHEYDAGVQFHGVFDDDRAIGYFIWGSCNVAPAMAKLHKCYLLTEYQGKGIGSMMLREAKKLAKDAGFSKLRLNVNRHNEKAMKSYFRNGFKVVEMVDNPIGEGFFMNDFVMEAELADGTVETDGNEPRDEESAASGMAIRKAHGGVVKDGRQAAGNEALPMASDERMQAAVISGLADDFDYVCHIDYKTGQFSCFRASELFARALSDIDLSLPYLKRLELLFRKLVYAEDLPRFLECFAAERVLKELEDKPVYKFETRLVYNNKTAFFRIKFARDQEDSNGVILGLLNIDKQVRAEILQGEQEAKIQSLKQMEEQARRQEKTLRKLIECMDRESIAYTVETMLQVIVDYYDADRVFVFEPDNGSAALNSTYEWSRDGVPGIREKLQHVPYSKMKHIINAMRQADFCTTLPGADEGAYLQADCRFLSSMAQANMLFVPLKQDDVMSGFIGVDNPRLFNADHVIVKTASSLVFGTLLRYRSEMLKRERDAQNDEVWVLQDMLRTARWSIEFGDDGLVSGAEWSQDFRKLLGFESIDDFPNTLEAWSQRVHPDDIQWVLDAFYAASKDRLGHVRFNVEYRIRHKNGLYRWLHAVAKFRHDENGHVVWAIGVSNDVSDAHELASLQAKEKENINRVMSLTDDFESIYDVNVDTGEYVVSNKSGVFTEDLLENLEFGPDYFESAARNIRVATYEKDKAMFQESLSKENILKVLDANQFFYIDYRLLIDGKPVWYRMKIVKVGNWGKEHRVLIGVFNNDRNKRQDDERQAYSEMAMALSASYECIYYVNLLDDSYIEFNKKGDFKKLDMEITGKDFFHSTMRNLKDVAYEEDLEMVSEFINKENIVKAVEEGETLSREYRIKFGDNFIHYRMKVAKSKSSKHHLVVAVENVEEEVRRRDVQQKQLEEALQMAQAANRAKTAFLNNMSHDIRTPMNAIIGFSGLAASHIDNREQVLDYLRKIGQSSDHLLSLINEVLDMSRIESGKMMLNEKDENLSEILHTLRDIIQADINAKQLELFIDTVDVTHENVICDKLRLNQVLLNITSNAIKYTRPGGTITIRMMQKKVTPNGYATYEFHIKDTGIGMSQEYVRTIFEPFTRESTSTVSGIQGTGLGMAISKNIVDMMGGKIDVTTKKDEGTEFVLTIDFKLGSNKQGEPTRIPQFEGLRGLVVDDDSSTCLSISRMLRDAGMRSEWCVSGKEAILRTTEAMQIGDLYKVYIIDWMMPDMNGIETTRRIRRVVGDNIPIIILTAYDWSDIENEAREAGVSGFVSKPMFPSDLHKALLQFCDGEKEEEAKAEPDMEFYGKKILLVDDNELNCEIAKELLEDNGFVVDTAADGTLAVEKMKSARSDDYDMILMDIQMPIMNGYDATRAIRAIDSEICKGIPIIAMTANAFAEDKEEALKAGMNDHIAKPIKVKILIETLRRYLNR